MKLALSEILDRASISSCYYGCIATGPDVLFNRDEETLRINPMSLVLHNIKACKHIRSAAFVISHHNSHHVPISISRSCLDSQPGFDLIYDISCRSVEVNITSRSIMLLFFFLCNHFKNNLHGRRKLSLICKLFYYCSWLQLGMFILTSVHKITDIQPRGFRMNK